MWKVILLVLGAVIGVILIYAALKPKAFSVQRSAVIVAPADHIFGLINDLKTFNTWNPFSTEPGLTLDYGTVTQGVGAEYSWGGKKSGVGQMKITDSAPADHVAMQLDFTRPMEAHNRVVFTLTPQAAVTQVTWTMSGEMPYAHRLMTTFFNMDKMVGAQFEQGLASLKALAEKH